MSGRRPTNLPIVRLCVASAAAVGMTLSAWCAAQVLDSTSEGQAWQATLETSVAPFADGAWRVLRGGLAFLAIPVLAVICLVAVGVALRHRSRIRALGVVAVVVGANVIVQAAKHSGLPVQDVALVTMQNLSGHIGVGTATALGCLLVMPPARMRTAIWGSWLLVLGLSAAILLSKWHTLSEALVPLLTTGAWAVAVFAVVEAIEAPARPRSGRLLRPGHSSAIILVVGGTTALVLVWFTRAVWNGHVGMLGALGASLTFTVGAAALTTGVAAAFLPPTSLGEIEDAEVGPGATTDGVGDRRKLVLHE